MFGLKRRDRSGTLAWRGTSHVVSTDIENGPCEYPQCEKAAINHIAIAPDGGGTAPLDLKLCRFHTARVLDNADIAAFLYNISSAPENAALRVARNSAGGELRRLDREQYLDRVITYLQSTDYFLGAFLASCFHPDWFYVLQADAERRSVHPTPGSAAVDAAIQQLIFSDKSDVRLVLRLSESTYSSKVAAAATHPRLIEVLIGDTQRRINEFFSDYRPQQRVTSMAIGHERIPYIFRDCVITAQRSKASAPIEYAILSTDPNVVDFEKRSFGLLFEQNVRSLEDDRRILVDFVERALTPLIKT
jgi:hypothetical protein